MDTFCNASRETKINVTLHCNNEKSCLDLCRKSHQPLREQTKCYFNNSECIDFSLNNRDWD
jgi:hypothetical protein